MWARYQHPLLRQPRRCVVVSQHRALYVSHVVPPSNRCSCPSQLSAHTPNLYTSGKRRSNQPSQPSPIARATGQRSCCTRRGMGNQGLYSSSASLHLNPALCALPAFRHISRTRLAALRGQPLLCGRVPCRLYSSAQQHLRAVQSFQVSQGRSTLGHNLGTSEVGPCLFQHHTSPTRHHQSHYPAQQFRQFCIHIQCHSLNNNDLFLCEQPYKELLLHHQTAHHNAI